MTINSLGLSDNEIQKLELTVSKFKQQQINELIYNSSIIGECSNILKNNKILINNNIDKLNPAWVRIMGDEIEKVLYSMREIVFQINNFEKIINSENN